MFDIESIINIFEQYRSMAAVISILISIVISLAGILPSIFVTGANIIFFGPVYGFIISLMGETIGGYITFRLYRLGLKSRAESFKGKYKLLDEIVDSRGRRACMLIAEGRLIPFIPSGFVTLAASLSSVNGAGFTLSTLIGKIPSILLESLVSYDVINIQENYIRLGFTVVGLLLVMITIKKKQNK
ncbi:MAG: VTT domain-containing protein [Clostridium sp.]|nr:VTT domain-containing protein [Clostridium sp.]